MRTTKKWREALARYKRELKAVRALNDGLLAARAIPDDGPGDPFIHGHLRLSINLSCPVCKKHAGLWPWNVDLRGTILYVNLSCGCRVKLEPREVTRPRRLENCLRRALELMR